MNFISTMIKTHRGGQFTRQQIEKIQSQRLNKLVNYVRHNSPYFQNLYADIRENFQLKDLPATNKIEMMKNFDDWITDSSITIEKIEKFTQNTDNIGRMIDNKYSIFKTSGVF